MSRARIWTSRGSFPKTKQFLEHMKDKKYLESLARLGEKGVEALREWTPKDSGLTADSWYCTIYLHTKGNYVSVVWDNTNIVTPKNGGEPFKVAVELQYGHGVKGGGYVTGIDYINPALRPIFVEIAEEMWKAVEES